MIRGFHVQLLALIFAAPLLIAADPLHPSRELGKAEGRCRANEAGPAIIVSVIGLKDRQGNLKLEVYPANDQDFLQDDKILVRQGKTFRRVEVTVPQLGTPQICVRVPAPGPYALSLLHDRDSNHKFGLSVDGIGFASNPRIGWAKPKAVNCEVRASERLTRIDIVMNYRRGLFSFEPLEHGHAYH